MPPATRPLDTHCRRQSLFGLPASNQIFRDIFTSSKGKWPNPASLYKRYQRALLFLLFCDKTLTSETEARGPPLNCTLSGDNFCPLVQMWAIFCMWCHNPNIIQYMRHLSFMFPRNTCLCLDHGSSLSRWAAKQAYLYPGPKWILSQWPASQESSKSSIHITQEPDPWVRTLPTLKGTLEDLKGRESKWRGYLLPGP